MRISADKCFACAKQSEFNILLIVDEPEANSPKQIPRLYLPNEGARTTTLQGQEGPQPVSFCRSCMRKVEDSLRATILYLQSENGLQ